MRFPFFPTPAEGETIYSGFCRCAARSRLSKREILGPLTGQRHTKVLLCSALPVYLKRLASSLPLGHPWTNPECVIRLHSAMPYYTYFDSAVRRNEAFHLIANNDAFSWAGMALGLMHYRCGAWPKHPRFCTDCNREDEVALGFSSFRREHQLPAIVVCWKHDCLLSHGCLTCGPYPIPRRGLSMPGRCLCANGQSPLPVVEELPGEMAILKWLASESAYMASADGTRCPCPRAGLFRQALKYGLCRGLMPAYPDIAAAMEERYGAALLNWLNYPAWTSHKPSLWIRKFFTQRERRTSTIIFLLFLGLFNSSVRAFETASTGESEDGRPCGKAFGSPEWKASLFPLSGGIARRLGQETLENIRSDLRAGMPKKEIQEKHRVGGRTIRLIEFDTPGLADTWKSAAGRKLRDAHRQKVLDLIARDPNISRTTMLKTWWGTYAFMLRRDREWFERTFPKLLPSKATTSRSSPCALDAKMVGSLDWKTQLPRLLAAYSFKLETLADEIGVPPNRVATEARKQGIRGPLSEQIGRTLAQETLEKIRSDLLAGMTKKEVQKKYRAGEWALRLIELDTPGLADAWKRSGARKRRDAHRQKVLDLIARDPNISRTTIQKMLPGAYAFIRERDKNWFEKALPQRRRGGRIRKTNRSSEQREFDSTLAEKARVVIRELKSTSHRPVWITKHCVLTRAGYSPTYRKDALPATEAVLREHVESRDDYVMRRIRWAVAEMAARSQTISGKTLLRNAGVHHPRLREYKQLVSETAEQLGVRVDPRSMFARDTDSHVQK